MVLDRNQMHLAILDTRSTVEQTFQVSQFPEQVVASFCAEKQAAHFGNLHVYSSLISGGRCKLDIGWLRHVLPPTRGRSLTYKHGGVKASRRYGREQKVRHSTRTAIYLGKLYYPIQKRLESLINAACMR